MSMEALSSLVAVDLTHLTPTPGTIPGSDDRRLAQTPNTSDYCIDLTGCIVGPRLVGWRWLHVGYSNSVILSSISANVTSCTVLVELNFPILNNMSANTEK